MKKEKIIVAVIVIILLFGGIALFISKGLSGNNNNNVNNNVNDNVSQTEDNCTLIKTYRINAVYLSNDENYLYATFSQYQVEGYYTIKLPKSISGILEKDKNYEFTFKINKKYVNDNPEVIFSNSEVLNVEPTDKIGMAQMNRCDCE